MHLFDWGRARLREAPLLKILDIWVGRFILAIGTAINITIRRMILIGGGKEIFTAASSARRVS